MSEGVPFGKRMIPPTEGSVLHPESQGAVERTPAEHRQLLRGNGGSAVNDLIDQLEMFEAQPDKVPDDARLIDKIWMSLNVELEKQGRQEISKRNLGIPE